MLNREESTPVPRPPLRAEDRKTLWAIASVFLGLFSLVLCYLGILVGVLAIFCALWARHVIAASEGRLGGLEAAQIGMWLGVAGIVWWALFWKFFPVLFGSKLSGLWE